MDWRVVAVLVFAATSAVGFGVLGFLLHRRGKQLAEARREVEVQKRRVDEALDVVASLRDKIELGGMSDGEAVGELLGHLSGGGSGGGAGVDGG